jgi:hypothetical protein
MVVYNQSIASRKRLSGNPSMLGGFFILKGILPPLKGKPIPKVTSSAQVTPDTSRRYCYHSFPAVI